MYATMEKSRVVGVTITYTRNMFTLSPNLHLGIVDECFLVYLRMSPAWPQIFCLDHATATLYSQQAKLQQIMLVSKNSSARRCSATR